MKVQLIKQGEHLPFIFDRNGQPIADWTCTIEVKQYPDDTAFISRTVTPTDSAWQGYLTQTETAALDAGFYYLIATLSNTTDDQEEQISDRFQVSRAWN